jgi:signal transduction histidine kinase
MAVWDPATAVLSIVGLALIFGGAWLWRFCRAAQARRRAVLAYARLDRLALLVCGLADELRGPMELAREQLASLRESLEDQPPCFERPIDPIDQTLAELDRLDAIVRGFIATVRPMPGPPRMVDVSALLRAWCVALEPELAARDVILVLEGASRPAPAIADPEGLKLIFWHLVRNARDAAPRGSLVRVSIERERDSVKVRVADSGPGIPLRRRASLFEPFTSTKPDGRGLGLAVARRLAEAMGATVAVSGGPPGAVLEVTLRRAPRASQFFADPVSLTR